MQELTSCQLAGLHCCPKALHLQKQLLLTLLIVGYCMMTVISQPAVFLADLCDVDLVFWSA